MFLSFLHINMKSCVLISSVLYKGYGLDSVTFAVEDKPYTYAVTPDVRIKVESLYKQHKKFAALNVAIKFGYIVKSL